jgi:hypothetical protein
MSHAARRRGARRSRSLLLSFFSPLAILMSGVLSAQAPATAPTSPATQKPAPAADRLPVRRVILYKSGVGYFEHLGRVRGNQTVTIDFTSGQLDDVLKSLTTLDLDGGRVSNVSYNSDASLERRLGALRLPIGQQATRAEFLSALRGARLEVRSGASRISGRLLSVERIDRRSDGGVTSIDTLSLVSDGGEIQTVALEPGVNVRIAEAALGQEVDKYLSLVASVRDQDVRRLTIATSGTGDRDLFVSYVSEVPVWKATYRLVLPPPGEARRPLLQGWAIVDNTVGEDWENVELSLVAGAPQSFVQPISRPYYVQRPVVPLPERVLLSPQTHQAAMGTTGAGALTGTVTDAGGGSMPGVTVRVTRTGSLVTQAVTDGSGRFRISGVTPGSYDLSFALPGFRLATRPSVNVSGGMETVLNVAMEVGGINENITVDGVRAMPPAAPSAAPRGTVGGVVGGMPAASAGAGAGGGRGGGAAFRSAGDVDMARMAQQIDAAAAQLGDLFEYKLKEPVTIRKNQSALVPIVGADVQADKVSLWNGASGTNRTLRAVWITNTTGLTLDGGSFSVIEGQAFAGEGLVEPLKAGERRLLSYAIDLAVTVDAKAEAAPTRVMKVQVARGLLIQQTEERQRRTYIARNEDSERRTLVVEHPARAGWTVGGTLAPAESTPAWHRFRVAIEPKTTATFTVEETRQIQAQVAVSSVTDNQVTLLVRDQAIPAPLEAALRQVLQRKVEIARLDAEINARQREVDTISRDQDRVRENMKSLKGSAEERQLLQRYVKQLDDQETRLETVRREIRSLTAERDKAQADLAAFIEGISG